MPIYDTTMCKQPVWGRYDTLPQVTLGICLKPRWLPVEKGSIDHIWE